MKNRPPNPPRAAASAMPDAGPGGDRLTARALSGFKWAIANAAVQALVSLATVMALARLLTPQDFGLLALAQIFITLADTVVRRGLGPAVIQRFDLTRDHVASGFTLTLLAGIALAGALWGFAPWLALLVGEPGAAPIMRVLALATLVTGAGVVSEHRLRRDLRFRALMAVSLLAKVLGSGFVAIGLALMNHGVWALVWGVVARQAVFTLAAIAFAPPPRALGAARREAGQLLRTGAGFSALALLAVLSTQAVKLAVAGTLGAATLGLYTRAQALSVVTARLNPVLNSVLLPAMARRQHRTDRLRTVHLNGAEMLSLLTFPASVTIAVSAPEIVAVILGAQWQGAVPALRILALSGAVHSLNPLHVPLIRATGAVYRESWRRALFSALLLGAVWFGSRWGLTGVAAAVGAVTVVQHALLTQLALSLLGVRLPTLLRRYLPALWVALWAAAALWLAAGAVRGAAWPPLPALSALFAAACAAAAAAAYLAPPFARPRFPHWGLVQLPFEGMGRPGHWARAALVHLAQRWPATQGA